MRMQQNIPKPVRQLACQLIRKMDCLHY